LISWYLFNKSSDSNTGFSPNAQSMKRISETLKKLFESFIENENIVKSAI